MKPNLHTLTFDTSRIVDTAIYWSIDQEYSSTIDIRSIYMHYDSPENPGVLRAEITTSYDNLQISYEYINGSSNPTFFAFFPE